MPLFENDPDASPIKPEVRGDVVGTFLNGAAPD